MQLTQGNPKMIKEVVKVYLEETPQLINTMKNGIDNNDWESLRIAAHSISPSFSMMGIGKEFEGMARKIQKYAEKREKPDIIKKAFLKIETVCLKARKELQQEFVL
jgi:HPt (histidine-containing phosphotransfer) domain-containing protein